MERTLFFLKNDKVLKYAFLGSAFLLFIQVLFLAISYVHLPTLVPLYLQRPWGLSQIATKTQIFLIPLVTIFAILLNTFLATFFYKDSPLISRILLWGQLIVCFLSTIATIRIILLII